MRTQRWSNNHPNKERDDSNRHIPVTLTTWARKRLRKNEKLIQTVCKSRKTCQTDLRNRKGTAGQIYNEESSSSAASAAEASGGLDSRSTTI